MAWCRQAALFLAVHGGVRDSGLSGQLGMKHSSQCHTSSSAGLFCSDDKDLVTWPEQERTLK